jgi:hypothetical protein
MGYDDYLPDHNADFNKKFVIELGEFSFYCHFYYGFVHVGFSACAGKYSRYFCYFVHHALGSWP